MLVKKVSTISGKENTMDLPITQMQVYRWQQGGSIQDVFPELSNEEREFLKSGITPEEWKELWKNSEEE